MLMRQTFTDFEWLIDSGGGTIGEKRNRLCERAKGEYIMNADSDDLYSPQWLELSLAHLEGTGANCTGLDSAYFASATHAWLYKYSGGQPYCMGATMVYRRSLWERNPFPLTSVGEDTLFCGNAGRVKPHNHIQHFVASIHDSNTASHHALPYMQPISHETVNFASEWYK